MSGQEPTLGLGREDEVARDQREQGEHVDVGGVIGGEEDRLRAAPARSPPSRDRRHPASVISTRAPARERKAARRRLGISTTGVHTIAATAAMTTPR